VAAPSISVDAHRDDCLLVCVNAQSASAIAEQYRSAFGQLLTLS
jgi:hypothetical protein